MPKLVNTNKLGLGPGYKIVCDATNSTHSALSHLDSFIYVSALTQTTYSFAFLNSD